MNLGPRRALFIWVSERGGMSGLIRMAMAIDAINDRVGRSVSWLILAAVMISAGNATTRKLFNLSSNAWLEAQWYLFSAVFLLAAGWTLLKNEHVKVDLVYGRLPRRAQLYIDLIGTLLFLFPFCLITIHLSWPIVISKFQSAEISNNTGGLLLWPVWLLIPVGFVLLLLQGASETIKRIAILGGMLPDPADIADPDESVTKEHAA